MRDISIFFSVKQTGRAKYDDVTKIERFRFYERFWKPRYKISWSPKCWLGCGFLTVDLFNTKYVGTAHIFKHDKHILTYVFLNMINFQNNVHFHTNETLDCVFSNAYSYWILLLCDYGQYRMLIFSDRSQRL